MNYNERLSKIRELCIKRIKQRVNDADHEELHRCILDLIYSSKGRSFIGYCDSFIKEYEKTFDDEIREALVRLYLIMTVGDKASGYKILKVSNLNNFKSSGNSTGGSGGAPGGGSPTEPHRPGGCAAGGGGGTSPEPESLNGIIPDAERTGNMSDPSFRAGRGTTIDQSLDNIDFHEVLQAKIPVSIKEGAKGGSIDNSLKTNQYEIGKKTLAKDKNTELTGGAIPREQTIIELIVSIVYNSVKTQKEKGI